MRHFEVDLSALSNLERPTYKLSDVKDRLIRVAADLVCFRDSPKDELWEIKSDDEGEYIVARYEDDSPDAPKTAEASVKSPWEALVKQGSSQVDLFYNGVHFTRFALFDAETVKNVLPKKLSTDKTFLSALLKTFSSAKQNEVKRLYPELF